MGITAAKRGVRRRPLAALQAGALTLVLLGSVPSLAASTWAEHQLADQPARDPRFSLLEQLLTSEGLPLVDAAADGGETLPDPEPDPLLDRLGRDLPCGTVVAKLAESLLPRLPSERAREVDGLLQPPHFSSLEELPLAGEGLVLRHDLSVGAKHAISRRDVDGDGVPDAVGAVVADLEFILREQFGELLNWDSDFGGSVGPLAIHIASSPYAEGQFVDGSKRHLVLPRHLGGVDRLGALAHQLAHVILREREARVPIGWEEAMATMLAEKVTAAAIGRQPSPLDLRQTDSGHHPRRALNSPGLLSARQDAAFLLYIDAEAGLAPGWQAELWRVLTRNMEDETGEDSEESSTTDVELAALNALDELLAAAGSSLGEAVREYQAAMLEEEMLGARVHPTVDEELAEHPSETSRAGIELPPFGAHRFAIEPPLEGGIRVFFEGDVRTEAELFALLDDGQLLRQPLSSTLPGEQSVTLPGSHVLQLIVQVRAAGLPADLSPWAEGELGPTAGEFSLSVEEDPTYPFELGALTVRSGPSHVQVDWLTESEEDILGWHVERARRPSGPWQTVTAAPFPAASRRGRVQSYALVDDSTEASTRYHYRLAAVTTLGLVERSASVTVLSLPEGPRLTKRRQEPRELRTH